MSRTRIIRKQIIVESSDGVFIGFVKRRIADRTYRTSAAEIGVSASTLWRVIAGFPPDAVTFCKIVVWLGIRSEDVVRIIEEVAEYGSDGSGRV